MLTNVKKLDKVKINFPYKNKGIKKEISVKIC